MTDLKNWVLMPNDYLYQLDLNDIIYDGFGYVILSNGTRIDFADSESEDIHKVERLIFNKNG